MDQMVKQQSDTDHLAWMEMFGPLDFADKAILDLGCGSGYLCENAVNKGASLAVGIDIQKPKGLDGNPILWQFESLNLDSPDWGAKLSEKHNQFHQILAFDILEHLRSPYDFLNNCLSLLAPNGQLFLTTPNTNSWERLMHPKDWSGVRDTQHKTLFSSYSLRFLLQKAGFESIETKAPMRKLSFLGPLAPSIGGQILCRAKRQ